MSVASGEIVDPQIVEYTVRDLPGVRCVVETGLVEHT